MRIRSTQVLVILLLVISFCSNAQLDVSKASPKKILKLARAYAEQAYYDQAEATYKSYISRDTTNATAYYELGMMQFTFLWKKEGAIPNLEKAIQKGRKKKDTVPEVCDALGQCYQFVENYDKAITFYEAFKKQLKDNDGGNAMKKTTDRYIEECMFAQDNAKSAKDIRFTNAGPAVNTALPEFDPVPVEGDNNLFFTSMRFANEDGSDTPSEEAYQNIYLVTKKQGSFAKPHRYHIFDSLEFGSKNIAAGSISFDNSRFFVCKDDKIYESKGKDTIWGIPVIMSDSVNAGFGQNHAFLSPDGNTIYFALNNAGGYGGLDIYKCEMQKNGSWGKAINLGKDINTPFDEEGPSMSGDGKTFYFSSKGHVGFGGFDIYKSTVKDGKLGIPVNMGRPFNSSADDLFLKFNKAGDIGYFSSGRPKGFGDMDIYKVEKVENIDCKTLVNKTYPVSFDATKSIDPEGVKLKYEWNMDDGTREYGTKFTHVYKRPGTYDVILTSIDSLTNRKLTNEAFVSVVIENALHVEFTSPDAVYQNDTVKLDGSSSVIPNKTASKYTWKIGEAGFGNGGSSTYYIFKNPGTYTIKMQVDFKCNNCKENESYCFSKNITVLEYNRRDKRRP